MNENNKIEPRERPLPFSDEMVRTFPETLPPIS
jgi:hypothetical protein